MNRRDIVKNLTALPLAGGLFPLSGFAHSTSSDDAFLSLLKDPVASTNIYQSIGVDPIINCRGTFTIIGGSVERPEVVAAMKAASGFFVQYDELAFAVGKKLADITGAKWGLVTSGCAAGLKHVTAACVTGGNPEKLIRIPDLKGFEKNEVIIPAYSRNVYDHAIRNIGVTVITVETVDDLKQAINSRTALIYIMAGDESEPGQPLSTEVIARIAKGNNIPVLVDAAAEILTIPNAHLAQGATVVAYSGGKAICGPQCAGLLLGDKDLLMSAWQASSPHHGPGRDNKVGKEEMMGMLAAVEAWTKRDHPAEWKTWLGYLDLIAKQVIKVEGVKTSVHEPTALSNRSPSLSITWDPDKLNITGDEVAEIFARTKPRIAVGSSNTETETSIHVTSGQMQPGNDKIVAERIVALLSEKRNPRTIGLKAATVDLGGHWDVEMHFFSSQSVHKFYLEQDGNWLQGTHDSDFAIQEIVGMVEGDQVKFRSRFSTPGDGITYMFSGTVKDNAISGSVYMGEYITATFNAKKTTYKGTRKRIVIPGGPPLAT
ncbi:MAG TPA: aminotransferase class V-fold PLP-dependent enzyme [Chryseolinea sp.]|nr:aminotransferase class V-fold PLP-dependent enzyme [Chryseolinea sp.]